MRSSELNPQREPGAGVVPREESVPGLDIPSEYRAGFAKARLIDPKLAELYVRHTMIGDPLADAVTNELHSHSPAQGQAWLQQAMDGGPDAIPDAPAVVRDFFAANDKAPAWFDGAKAAAGCRAFHRHSEMFIGAFVGAVLIEGFATLISKSFSITGRLVDQGVRRLKQNNRHLMEIFLPGGLDRQGDGWKLSVRIRLVHARIRLLLSQSEDWDTASWGVPLSSAHIAFATAVFSAVLLQRAGKLGVKLSAEERESFMMIWRYSGYLMGVDPELLFSSEAGALKLHQVGALCEPPPDFESKILANGLINSAPIVAGITEPAARRKLAGKIYRISRALIGDELADQLGYPPDRGFTELAAIRWQNRLNRLLQGWFPSMEQRSRAGQFQAMLNVSYSDSSGIQYRMPGHVHAEKDKPL